MCSVIGNLSCKLLMEYKKVGSWPTWVLDNWPAIKLIQNSLELVRI